MRSPIRWLTALAIICICSFAVGWGWQATQFGAARLAVMNNPSGDASLIAWNDVPGLAGEALEASLRRTATAPVAPALDEARLEALLAVRPMATRAWLSVASDRFVLGQSASQIDFALTMSRVTGPNEGTIMWQRGLLELVRWQMLSDDARRQAAADLASALSGNAVNAAGVSFAKAILVQQPSAARAEIATALGLAGLSDKQLAIIGLQAAHG